jgi:hypothetical protein
MPLEPDKAKASQKSCSVISPGLKQRCDDLGIKGK